MSMSTTTDCLPYTLQCQQVLSRDGCDPVATFAPGRPRPRFTDRLFAPKPDVDPTETMCTLMDNCRPSFLAPHATSASRRRPAASPSVTAKKCRGPDLTAQGAPGAPSADVSASPAHPQETVSHVAALTWRLSDAQHQVEARGTYQPPARRIPHTPLATPPPEDNLDASHDSVGALRADDSGEGGRRSTTAAAEPNDGCPCRGLRKAYPTTRRTRAWMDNQTKQCPVGLPPRPLSASLVGYRSTTTTPMARLLRNKFEPTDAPALPYFATRGRAASAASALDPKCASLAGTAAASSGMRPCSPAFLTDGATAAQLRPTTRATSGSVRANKQALRAPLADSQGCSTWLDGVLHEPIYSYNLMRTIAPPARPSQPFTTAGESAAAARRHLVYAQQQFDHDRIARQNDLELFLDYRSECRKVVACRAATAVDADSMNTRADEDVTEAIVASNVREALLPLFEEEQAKRATCRYAATPGKTSSDQGALTSVWTDKVEEMAFEEQKARVCAMLSAFQIDFPAAALSLEAMEKLRADVIERIRCPPPSPQRALPTPQQLTSFLIARAGLTKARLTSHGKPSVDDIADAMPSQAEAAFVRHAFATLSSA